MKYALNVADLTRFPTDMLSPTRLLLPPVTPDREIIHGEPGMDGDGLVLQCDEDRAQAIIKILHNVDLNQGRYLTRIYRSSGGAWQRVTLNEMKSCYPTP